MPTGSPMPWIDENRRAFQLMRLWIEASGGESLHASRTFFKLRPKVNCINSYCYVQLNSPSDLSALGLHVVTLDKN